MDLAAARWLAPRALRWLGGFARGRVLHAFDRSVNLVDSRGSVLSIVDPEIGPGPFSLVLAQPFDFRGRVAEDSPVEVDAGVLTLGPLAFGWSGAEAWDPVPPWRSVTPERTPGLVEAIEEEMLVSPVKPAIAFEHPPDPADQEALRAYAVSLAGLGPGLTPSGDDVLVGLAHAFFVRFEAEAAAGFAGIIAETAARTTTLSAAWLRAAAVGEAGNLCHLLVAAAAAGDETGLRDAVRRILATGHTSGADALAGFTTGLKVPWPI
ncbi:MAG TPA: DUF2877 domain-containing protein [Anaerolineales bacterium]|nr:DUF2877 domain-containing protein [Anaerolineales bacterium]